MLSDKNRIIQFDVMRVVAALSVVWLHSSAQFYYDCFPSAEWDARNVYDSMVRWSVPVFVMISGALFLDAGKQISLRKLYSKNVFRIIVVYLFWSTIFTLYGRVGQSGISVPAIAMQVIDGPFHFWFLKMLVGLYICVPLLRAIVADRKLEIYFICLCVVTAFIIPMLFPLLGIAGDSLRDFAEKNYDMFGLKGISGYAGYFVLGHYLANNAVPKKIKQSIYVLGAISLFAVIGLTCLISFRLGAPNPKLYDNINPFTLFEALAVFIFMFDRPISAKYHPAIVWVSKLSLGIYIIHPLVMSVLNNHCGITTDTLNPVFFIPIYAVGVFVLSGLITFALNKIPGMKKFMM